MLIGTVGMAVSCQKEQIVKNQATSAESNTAKLGGDAEDPIVKGKVKKSNQMPVNKALVEVFDCEANLKVAETYTNGYGDFEHKVHAGVFYLKVTNPDSGNTIYTGKMRIDSTTVLEVIVD